MQNEFNNNSSQILETKSAWQRPTISRIDIKRTMIGSPGAVDGLAGTAPSPPV